MDWKKAVRIGASAVLTLLILLSVLGMALLGAGVRNADQTGTFSLFGYSYHLNKSADMEPDILKNDLISIRQAEFSDVQPGDYIAFSYLDGQEQEIMVRRVQSVDSAVCQAVDTAGNVLELTAENCRLLGLAEGRSPSLGKAAVFLQTEDGKMIFMGWTAGIALLLLGLTLLFHVIWKLIGTPRGPSDGITGVPLRFDEPVRLPKRSR